LAASPGGASNVVESKTAPTVAIANLVIERMKLSSSLISGSPHEAIGRR
jgi:hypothetical protein